MPDSYLPSILKQFEFYKMLGERAMRQVPEDKLFWTFNEESNSLAVIVKHLWGNMLSRWTDFLTSDGEKVWRQRDAEFENDIQHAEALWQKWEAGWEVLFLAIRPLSDADLEHIVYIRNQGHTVVEAINRQLAHYAYHVGQIVFLSKMLAEQPWESLSIPKGQSDAFNQDKFNQPRQRGHFTNDFLPEDN